MSTTARIYFEGRPAVFVRNDGFPEVVVPHLKAWIEADTGTDVVYFIENRRQAEFPQTYRMMVKGEVREMSIPYEPMYFRNEDTLPSGLSAALAGADFEYTVTSDGRIFGGRELT